METKMIKYLNHFLLTLLVNIHLCRYLYYVYFDEHYLTNVHHKVDYYFWVSKNKKITIIEEGRKKGPRRYEENSLKLYVF